MRTLKNTNLTLLILTTQLLSFSIHSCDSNNGRDWVKWNGPFANGTTDETNWNPNSISDSTKLIWRSDIGRGHSMVAVKGKLVYVFGNKQIIEKKDTSDFDIISCLNSSDGSNVWSYKYKSDKGNFPGPSSSPIIDGKFLYALSRNGDLHCLNASNGELTWKQQIKEMGFQSPGFGFSCSPLIHDDFLVLKAGETGIALNKMTGEEIWHGDTTRYNSYSSAVLVEQNNKKELMVLNGDSLHLLDTKTGSKHYSYPWKDVGSDPLIYNNSVFLSNFNDGAILLDITQNPPELIWKNDSANGLFQGFVRYGDYAYGFANKKPDMPLRCINLQNGEIEWETNLDKWGSLIIANDKLVIITGKGRLIVAETSPKKYTEISSIQIFDIGEEEFKKNRNCCWTKPVLSHGKIYVRTAKGELACIDVNV